MQAAYEAAYELDREGLPAALRKAAGRVATHQLACADAGRYAPEIEAAVYFCCLETLQNAAKHAGYGATATVHLTDHDHILTFRVADNGAGFLHESHLEGMASKT
jgi:signal transduction histidine kinase